jgi:hypothetical protein
VDAVVCAPLDAFGVGASFARLKLREVWFGNTDEARLRATFALKQSTSRDLMYFAALALDADPDIPILQQAKAEYAKLP